MRRVKLEKNGVDFILRPSGVDNPFRIADSIYFRNLLLAEQDAATNSFLFRRLGRQGITYLFAYLDGEGFTLELDASASRELTAVRGGRQILEESRRAGAALKRKPKTSLRIRRFQRGLKPFQVPATAHMIAVAHAANFSVPGSGKTTIALATFAQLKSEGTLDMLVVVGPRSSFAPWESEAKICLGSGTKVVRITGSKTQRVQAWRNAARATIAVLNYHVAVNDSESMAELLSNRHTMLVADESHYIKSMAEGPRKWTTAMRSVAPLATKRVILSGTPAPNSLADLWSQFTFLYPDEALLGTKDQFNYRIEKSKDAVGDLKKDLSPLFWRIKKRELGLPRPKVTKLRVKLGPVQQAIYDALAFKVLRDAKTAPAEAVRLKMWRRAKMIRLLQAASNPALLAQYSEQFRLPPISSSGLPISELIQRYPDYEVPSKIKAAVALINKLTAKGRKVILWTSFVHNIKMLMRLLADIQPLPLFGGIALSDAEDAEVNREKIINTFRKDSSAMLLIANPAACAESISLHKICGEAVYLDRTFNCAHFLQSKDRIHRVGLALSDSVNYHYFIGDGSIDEVIDRRLGEKESRMVQLLEQDFGTVNLDSNEDVVSEDSEEATDFAQTLAQIKSRVCDGQQSQ